MKQQNKIKIKLIGTNNTVINVDLDVRVIPLYGQERRCEIPPDIFKDLVDFYNTKSCTKNAKVKNEKINIIIEISGEKNIRLFPSLVCDPNVNPKLMDEQLIADTKINEFVNSNHHDWNNERVVVPPRFILVDKLSESDSKYALRKSIIKENKVKDIRVWYSFLQKIFCKKYLSKSLIHKTTYAYRLYTTNVIKFMDAYNVYVVIDKKEEKQYIQMTINKSKGLKLINNQL